MRRNTPKQAFAARSLCLMHANILYSMSTDGGQSQQLECHRGESGKSKSDSPAASMAEQ
jgi:hypothetical protein